MTFFFVLAMLALIFFVLGAALVFQGYRTTPNPDEVVAKDELQKAQEGLQSAQYQESQLRLQLDALAVQLETANDQLKEAQGVREVYQQVQSQESQQRSEKESLQQDLRFMIQKSDNQAQDALAMINLLVAENEELKNQLKEAAEKIDPQDVARLNTQNLTLREQLEKNTVRIQELEDFLAKQKRDFEQRARTTEQDTQKYAAENQKLKQGLSQLREKIAAVSQGVEREQQREEETLRQAQAAQHHLTLANQQIDQLQKALSTLTMEKERYDRQVQDLQKKLQDVPDGTPWLIEKARLETQLKELQNNNALLQDKEKLLASELKKSRAQALAMESFCAGLQQQLARPQG